MIRRLLLVLVILFVALFTFSFDTEVVTGYFIEYINDYNKEDSQHPFVQDLKRELNNLVIYRLYKFQMVGSIERRETSTTIAGLLTDFFRTIPADAYTDQDDRLAFGAFLGWVMSEYTFNDFQPWTLSQMPSYTRAFNDYTAHVRSAASVVFKAWFAHSLGVLEERPNYYPDELPLKHAFPDLSLSVTLDPEKEELIASLISRSVLDRIVSGINQIAEREYSAAKLFREDVIGFVEMAVDEISDLDPALRLKMHELLKLWVYRALSLIEDAPGFPEEMTILEKDVPGFENTLPTDQEYYTGVLTYFDENPGKRSPVAERLGLNARILMMRDYEPSTLLESDIEAEVRRVVPALTEGFTALRADLSASLVAAAGRTQDLWWLRFVFYIGSGLGVFFLLPNLRSYLLGGVVSVELFYMLFFSNINLSTMDVSVYAVAVIPVFVFTLILTVSSNLDKKRRSILSFLQLVLVLFILVLPLTRLYDRVDELAMDEFPEFYSSIYYETLKRDLFLSDTARFSFHMRDVRSVISTELNDLKRAIRVLIPNVMNSLVAMSNSEASFEGGRFRIRVPAFDPFLSIANQEEYVEGFDSLQRSLRGFVRTSSTNYRTYLRRNARFVTTSVQIVHMSGEQLRQDFVKHVRSALGAREEFSHPLETFEEAIEGKLARDPEPAVVRPYSSSVFTPILLGAMVLGSSSVFFKRRPVFIYVQLGLLVAAFVRGLIYASSLDLFVHSGLPTYRVITEAGLSAWFLVFFVCIISVCLVKAILSHKKRREINEN